MVLGLSSGKNVRELYLKEHAKEEDAKVIVKQVLQATKALHKANIYHNDLKPSNWMAELPSLKITIIDFGLAVMDDFRRGTVLADGFQPPEYFISHSYLPSRVDAWMIGVSLYFIMHTRKPFGMDAFMNDKDIYIKRLKALDYSLGHHLSADLKDFLSSILVFENNRPSIDELLEHSWLQGVHTP